jgi:integral membrane protein (TIGR01906 family)
VIVDAAFAPARATPRRPRGWEVALFAAALAACGLVLVTISFAGESTYADLALAPDRAPATFATLRTAETPPGAFTLGRSVMSREQLLELHRGWLGYLLGRRDDQPAGPPAAEYFTASERAHMADVRDVFIAAQIAAGAAALVLVWLAANAWRGGSLARLVRAGSLSALALVAVVGIVAAVAFEAVFLLFHQIFFPQGNFLFEPGSNLLVLYPQDYFYGVTLRIGAAFVAGALVLAAAAHASLRVRGASA